MACPKRKIIIASIILLLVAALAIFFGKSYCVYQQFLEQTDLTAEKFKEMLDAAVNLPTKSTDGKTNFLLLGTDTLEYRASDYPLTDTIMLGSLDLASGTLNLLSLPRDIYLPEINKKINAIYPSFYQESSTSALAQTTSKISELTEIPIHYSAVINMADLADFLDLIGGVQVTIDNSFTDHQFPREGVDVTTVTDPAILYETVSFASGEAQLNAVQALQFMRSRHGDGNEGNDYARSRRQQKVLTAVASQVIARLKQELSNLDFTFLGQLYQFYQERYQEQIPFEELLALGRDYLLANKQLTMQSHSLAISPGEAGASLQEVEASWRNGNQWSLSIINRPALLQEIKNKLAL
ncbi:MAG: LCP family protein [bacterium]|nr:LCP family protein [bacterium]